MNGDYSGKHVLITGGASGIGRALALLFAREGASLLLVDINQSGLEAVAGEVESHGVEARRYQADVSDADQVARLHDKVTSEAGTPDILINCAGVAEMAAIEEAPLEDWRTVLGVNLWGSIHTLHYFLPDMYERGSGHVVNVASAAGLAASAFLGLYVTSKFALVGLTETLRAEAAVHGVGVAAICPGFIETPLLDKTKTVGFAEEGSQPLRKYIPKPEKLAKKILICIKRDKPMLIYPASFKVIIWIKRRTPRGSDKFSKKAARTAYNTRHISREKTNAS